MQDQVTPWRWLGETQAVTVTPERLAEPAALVARIAALSRAAVAALPFDIDPTGFTQELERLATSHGDRR